MFDAPTRRLLPSERVVRVHLLRHGEVAGGRVCRGHLDAPLTERGQAQTAALAEAFAARLGPRVDALLSSDLARCTALADAVATRVGCSSAPTPALREQHMGGWEGRSWESLTVEDPDAVNAYWADYVDAVPPGGESWRACHDRVVRWWDASAAAWPDGGVVIVVTHVGVIRALLCHFLGLPPGEALRFTPAFASHTELLVADAGVVIEALGERLAGEPAARPVSG